MGLKEEAGLSGKKGGRAFFIYGLAHARHLIITQTSAAGNPRGSI